MIVPGEAITREAEARGANAIVGVDPDDEIPGGRGSMLMASANGIAAVVEHGGAPPSWSACADHDGMKRQRQPDSR